MNGLDREDYLRNVLERIADHPVKRIGELPPWNLAGIRRRQTSTFPSAATA